MKTKVTRGRKAKTKFTNLAVLADTKEEFVEIATERRRDIYDVVKAAAAALNLLPRDQQDALIEGRPVVSPRP